MRRGEIWTVAAGQGYAGKPRPAVIIQDDRFGTDTVSICALTSDPTDAPLIRVLVEPNETNGLRAPSRLMIDKITTVPRTKLGSRVGALDHADVKRLNQSILVFLGLAGGFPGE